LFDVACSLTDVLSLLPTQQDPFVVGPRDYLTQFLTLLSTLRNGDNRFLPLLLAKVHDVLPRLVSPMLQQVPDTPTTHLDPNVDIFDGFGNAGMGVASSLPSQYDTKRIEDVSSSHSDPSQDSVPYTTPPIITNAMEYPGMNAYHGFQSMTVQSPIDGHNQIRMERPAPIRTDSSSSYVIQRSMPEYHLQRENNGLDGLNGMGITVPPEMGMSYRR
jgi:hypothetical protein